MASILLIDDDRQVRSVLRALLRLGGHAVREAGDGDEGLRHYRERRPDLVVCDLYMARTAGAETIRELHRLDPGVRLITMSGDADLLPAARALGAHATLAKPFSLDALTRCVDRVLAQPG